jgi:hypothetical protein
MSELGIVLINNDSRDKVAYDATGESYRMHGHEQRSWPAEIAQLFLAQCAGFVTEVSDVELPRRDGEPLVWVANMTGDLRLPVEIKRPVLRENREVFEAAPNPLREPRTLRYQFKPDQVVTRSDDGFLDECFDPVKTPIVLAPWSRRPLTQSLAMFLTQRDGMQADSAMRGALITCRAPTEFEPNASWSYGDIRIYANIVDSQYFATDKLNSIWKPESKLPNDMAILEAKHSLLRALHYWLADPRVSLPTKAAFDREHEGRMQRLEGKIK